jgi:hypothetical protein
MVRALAEKALEVCPSAVLVSKLAEWQAGSRVIALRAKTAKS